MQILEAPPGVTIIDIVARQNSRTTVCESPIHGKGLFVCDWPIIAGEVILKMDPSLFSVEKFHPWNGQDMGTVPYFINHSCKPNAVVCFSEAKGEMTLVAATTIWLGEEITIDYNLVEVGGTLITCNCRSENCRGTFPVNRRKLD
jgi:hypothetical protein